jgi:hypothetical protein
LSPRIGFTSISPAIECHDASLQIESSGSGTRAVVELH